MKDTYCFPAIFTKTQEGISVAFPDLPGCVTCADNHLEAAKMARDCLGSWLYTSERDNEFIPVPSNLFKLKDELKDNQIIVRVRVYMPTIRSIFAKK